MTSINGGPISVDLSAGNRQTMTPEAMPSKFPASFALETSHCLYTCGDTIGARFHFILFLFFPGEHLCWIHRASRMGERLQSAPFACNLPFLDSVICTACMLYDVMCCTYMSFLIS